MSRYYGLTLLLTVLSLLSYSFSSDSGTATIDRGNGRRPLAEKINADDSSAEKATTPPAIAPLPEVRTDEIEKLIRQLGSPVFAEREEATHRLEKIGDPAVRALHIAAANETDLEVRRRAKSLLAVILNKDLPQRFGESVATIEEILPAGWHVMRTISRSVPPDWWTDEPKAGFLVEARKGEEVFQIWFLPPRWIGIRKTPSRTPLTCYWHGILACEKYKTITFASDEKLQERVHHLGGHSLSTPCLVNSGYDQALRLFAGRLDHADRIAAALVRKHCHTPEQFHEAVTSLDDLGVPARRVFLRAARYARGKDPSRYASLLGLIGGEEAINLLCDILTDLEITPYERKYAVYGLRGKQDQRIGPALHLALKQMPDGEALDAVVKELMHRRYRPAVPDLLARLKRMENSAYGKGALADALAAFRCKEAIPELRRWQQQLRNRKKHDHLPDNVDLALLRLADDWDKPGASVRLYVVPPEQPRLGAKIELTVYMENCGTKSIKIWPLPREMGLRVDGQSVFKREIFAISGIVWDLEPGELRTFTCDLTPYLKTPGRHQVQYEGHGASSNAASFVVQSASP